MTQRTFIHMSTSRHCGRPPTAQDEGNDESAAVAVAKCLTRMGRALSTAAHRGLLGPHILPAHCGTTLETDETRQSVSPCC